MANVRRQRGMSLIELMVALAIGTFLLAGTISVFGKTRDLYRTNDSAARLQETARYAMSTLEADLRMANYWGLMSRADLIENGPTLDPANPPNVNPTYTLPAGLTGYGGDHQPVRRDVGDQAARLCRGDQFLHARLRRLRHAGAVAGSDTLTIRRVSTNAIAAGALAASAGQIKIQTSRVQGTLFANGTVPAGYAPPLSETRAVVVNGYYVDQDSDERAGTPSLRRKQLDVAGGAPAITDLQIVPGVEDLQVELGGDFNGDQNADYFVPPNTAIPAGDQIVAVRIWLLVRAEQQETGFTDNRRLHLRQPRRRCPISRGCIPPGPRQQDDRAQEYTAMNGKSLGPRRQQGAALVIGLILLVVLTILAVSGVFTSTMELRMVRNTQSQEHAFQAAEVAIEDALANPVLSTSAVFNQATIAVPNSPGDTYSYRLQFVGQAPLGTGMTGYSIGTTFQTYHFQVDATGNGPDSSLSNHTQSFYVVGPGT